MANMETPKKDEQKLPMLTPKNQDGSQRVIKQIMVIDPNKLRVAGLDLKMAEALKKSKGRSASSSPVIRSKDEKLALAKNLLNKKIKAKESALIQVPSDKSVAEAIRKLSLSPVSKPHIKVADLKSLMPPPTSPVGSPPPNESKTVLLNFLKRDQKSGSIEVSFVNPTESQNKVKPGAIPKASIRGSIKSQQLQEIPKTMECKVISPEVKFEMKKRPLPSANKVISVKPSQNEKSNVKIKTYTPQKPLPKVIENKVLAPEEQIDLRTLCVTSPTQIVPASVPLEISKHCVIQQKVVINRFKPETKNLVKDSGDLGEVPKPQDEPLQPVKEESAVDFINFLFEEKSKKESNLKTVPKTGTKLTGEDATVFLMSLLRQQTTLESMKCPTDIEPLSLETNKYSNTVDELIQSQQAERLKIKVSESKEKFPLTSVKTESKQDRTSLTHLIPSNMIDTEIAVDSTQPLETVVREVIISQEVVPTASGSPKEHPFDIVKNETEKVDIEVSPVLSTFPPSECSNILIESSLITGDNEEEQSAIDQCLNEKIESRSEHSLSSDVAVLNSIVMAHSSKEEKESLGEHNHTKIDYEDATATPMSRKTKESSSKNERKVEEAPATTINTRRKGTKTVPVLIAKLKRNRKPTSSQEKPSEKAEQVIKGPFETEGPLSQEKSLEKIPSINESTSEGQDNLSLLTETFDEGAVTRELNLPDTTSESVEKPSVYITSEKSRQTCKHIISEKNPNETRSDAFVDEENPISKDVEDKSDETKFTLAKNSEDITDERKEQMQPSPNETEVSKENKTKGTSVFGAARGKTRRSTTLKSPLKLDNTVKNLSTSHPANENETQGCDELTDFKTTTISNEKKEELREVESEIGETPTTSKGNNRRSTVARRAQILENISPVEDSTPKSSLDSENTLKPQSPFHSNTEIETQNQDDKTRLKLSTIAKGEIEKLSEIESKIAESHAASKGVNLRSIVPRVQKALQVPQSTNSNVEFESLGLGTEELSQISKQQKESEECGSKNTRRSRIKSNPKIAISPDEGNTTELFAQEAMDINKTASEELLNEHDIQEKTKALEGSIISEKFSISDELNSKIDGKESASTRIPDVEMHNALDKKSSTSIKIISDEKIAEAPAKKVNFGAVNLKENIDHVPTTSTKKKKNDKETLVTEGISPDIDSASIDIDSSTPDGKFNIDSKTLETEEGDPATHRSSAKETAGKAVADGTDSYSLLSKKRRSTKKKETTNEAAAIKARPVDIDSAVITIDSSSKTISQAVIADAVLGEKLSFEHKTSKEKNDDVPSTSKGGRTLRNEKQSEVLPTDIRSPDPDSSEALSREISQVVPDAQVAVSISEATISEYRTPRSRKKTVKFEEYSRGSVKSVTKTSANDSEPLEDVQPIKSLFDSIKTPSPNKSLPSGKQSKRTSRLVKAKINLVDRKKPSTKKCDTGEVSNEVELKKSSECLENKSIIENVSSPSKDISSQSFDNSKVSDDSDGFEDLDSDLTLAVIATEETVQNDIDRPEFIIKSALSSPDKTPNQVKAKYSFKKANSIEKVDTKDQNVKDGSNEESGFLGFNEEEIEEGQQSTSLRLSQSEEVIPLQLSSPSGSSDKIRVSPRVKKAPLSGGKKQKAEQQKWTKNAAASLKNWLTTPDKSTEAELGDEKVKSNTYETNSLIPLKKCQDKVQSSIESINIEAGVKPLQDDLKPTSKLEEERSLKLGIEEGAPVNDSKEKVVDISGKGGDTKRKKASVGKDRSKIVDDVKSLPKDFRSPLISVKRKGAIQGDQELSSELDVTPVQEETSEKGRKTKRKKGSLVKAGLEQQTSNTLKSKILTVGDLKPESENKNLSSIDDIPKIDDGGEILANPSDDVEVTANTAESKTCTKSSSKLEKREALDIENKINAHQDPIGDLKTLAELISELEDSKTTESRTQNKPEKKKLIKASVDKNMLENKKSPIKPAKKEPKKTRINKKSHDNEDKLKPPLESTGDLKTPIKSESRKRKRLSVEENTPEIEPPSKIPHITDQIDYMFTPPAPRRRGRPPKSEANVPRRPKLAYVPAIPVSPLEKKYKNDTEFNPRLLLIRRKEELKTDAPIIDPEMQTVPKSKDDVQCALCLGYTTKKKWLQHVSDHYGIGWIVGTPPPLNVKSRASVLNFMVEFFKSSKVKGLNCRLCQGQRRSALGLLVHLEQCCMTEDELKESRVQCEHCNNNYSRSSIIIHLRSCSSLLKKSRVEVEEEQKATEGAVNEEDVLSNTGRLKRKSVIKAEHKFKNLDDIEFLPDELIKHIPQIRTDNHLPIWHREILRFGKGFCLQKKCPFTAKNVEELVQHCQETVCPFIAKPGYFCMKCKFHGDKIEPVRTHVVEVHKPRPAKDFEESEDEAIIGSESSSESVSSGDEEGENSGNTEGKEHKPKKKRKAKNVRRKRLKTQKNTPTKDFKKLLPDREYHIATHVANWYEEFIQKNYTKDALFTFATPRAIQTDSDGYESYFPKSAVSMKFVLGGFDGFVKEFGVTRVEPDQWQNLERLKGTGLSKEHAMYVGGPVKSIAWVPLEPHPPSSTQYLAIATRKAMDKFTRFVQPKLSRSLIYIQKYHINEPTGLNGDIHYALPIDTGPVHCIEFLPSGGYVPEMNRLGLLAVATVQTEIKIYSLPLEVEKRNCDNFPIVRLEPSYVLCLELMEHSNSEYSDEYQSQCMNVVWSQTAGHNYIIGGYLNGYVAIWDISDEDDNLNRFLVNGTKKFVPVSYFWTMDNRIKQVAAHYDMNGLRWLAVCNSTRKLLIYDLREITKPVLFYVDTTKNVCNSADWPIVWENPSYGLGDAMPSHGCCINTLSPMSLVFINRRFDKFCCGVNDIHFNVWRNVYAAGADNGDIHVTTLREAVLDVSLRMKNDEKSISTLDIVSLDGEKISRKTSQPISDSWRVFEVDYKEKYGLVFGSTRKIVASKHPGLYGANRRPPLNLCRLMRVNRLRFNPNRNANALLAVGYDNGFLRVLQSNCHKTLKDSQQ